MISLCLYELVGLFKHLSWCWPIHVGKHCVFFRGLHAFNFLVRFSMRGLKVL